MQNEEQHVSNDELLLYAHGELKRGLANRVRTHLEDCACCRTRAAEIENILIETAQSERSSLEAELPSIDGPRAMLRARLTELSTGKASVFTGQSLGHRFGHRFGRRAFESFPIGNRLAVRAVGMAALAAMLVVAGILGFRHSTAPSSILSFFSSGNGILPNHALTPGAVRQVSLQQVCSLPNEEVIKDVSPAERQRVFAEYGIPNARSSQYEVDYLITPGLGGEDNIRNLWPEPYRSVAWNAHVKDALEAHLHQMVCSRQLDLSVAQEAIATNWILAYEKYVQPAPSTAQTDRTAASLAMTVHSIALMKDAGNAHPF